MRITITTTGEMTRYAVKNGQIYYVKLSKPCAISDLDDPFAELDITPYLDKRRCIMAFLLMIRTDTLQGQKISKGSPIYRRRMLKKYSICVATTTDAICRGKKPKNLQAGAKYSQILGGYYTHVAA